MKDPYAEAYSGRFVERQREMVENAKLRGKAKSEPKQKNPNRKARRAEEAKARRKHT